MLPYFILVAIPVAGFMIFINDKKQQKFVCMFSFFFILFCLLSFRDITIGVDLKNYKYIFETVGAASWGEIFDVFDMEKGYVLLNKLVFTISNSFQFFLCVVALITMIPLFFLYKNETENPLLTIALFMTVAPFSMYFSGLRQAIAISLMVPAYYFVKKKKLIPFVLMVFLISLFHKSGFIVLILYPIYHFKISTASIWLLGLFLIITWIFRAPIFSFVMDIIGGYGGRYDDIQDTGAYAMLILFVVFAVYSYVIPDPKKMSDDTRGLRNVLFLVIAIQVFASVSTVVMRMNYFFLILIPILIPKIVEIRKTEWVQMANLSEVVMVGFFFAYFFYGAYMGEDILNIFPYLSIWGGMV